jgi:hypothetical protein
VTACQKCGNPTVFCSCWSAADAMAFLVLAVFAVEWLFRSYPKG